MKKQFNIFFILFLFSKLALSQQDPQFSHDMFNLMGTNPGFAGMGNEIKATVINRQQWVGFEGAPKTTLFTIESSLSLLGLPGGAGITLYDDRIGFEKNFNGKISYSYHKALGTGTLGIGFEVGILNKAISGEWKALEMTDKSIPNNSETKMTFDLGLGLFYMANNWYLGLSTTHIHQPAIKFDNNGETFLKRHYFLQAGYNIPVTNALIDLTPSTLIKSDGVSTQFSLNINLTYNKKFWGGVTYRNQDALIGLIGLELFAGLRLGYAYDIILSQMRKGSSGSHEIYLNYSFNLGIVRIPQRTRCVRNLY